MNILLMLQILSLVLEMVPFSFGIRMAALASRKELVDLEKWLNTNLVTYKDTLFEVLFYFWFIYTFMSFAILKC